MANMPFYYIENTSNDLFTLFVEMDDDLKLDPKVKLAVKYLQYLGTDKYTNEELLQKLYSLGVNFSSSANSWKVYLFLSGLEESFDEAQQLMEELILNAQPDEAALKNLIADELKEREDNKKNKWNIMSGIQGFAKYGPDNKFNNQLSSEELNAITAQELVDIIHRLTSYSHKMFYYGKTPMNDVFAKVKANHVTPETLLTVENALKYKELPTNKSQVYFVDYDMVQTEMRMLSKGELYNPQHAAFQSMFNEFFGSGLSSIVFQEIRESKALAYAANAWVSTPSKADESHYVSVYVGTQNNKLGQAVDAMAELMSKIPEGTGTQFEESRTSALKQIESDRLIKDRIYWNYRSLQDKGIDYDIRKNIYEKLGTMTMDEMNGYFNSNIANRSYVYCVIGKKSEMDMAVLKKLGPVKELTLKEVFGY